MLWHVYISRVMIFMARILWVSALVALVHVFRCCTHSCCPIHMRSAFGHLQTQHTTIVGCSIGGIVLKGGDIVTFTDRAYTFLSAMAIRHEPLTRCLMKLLVDYQP